MIANQRKQLVQSISPRRPTHHANTEHRNDDSQARERLYVNGDDSCHRGDRDFGNDQRAKFDQLETFSRDQNQTTRLEDESRAN